MNRDTASTLAGGAAGFVLLQTVRWEAIAHGEPLKVVVALTLIGAGIWLYWGE
ncbi:MAG: hypothetical protein ACLPX8_09530 [Bryobacteraceae bacterium]|jgi:hypothetical protein